MNSDTQRQAWQAGKNLSTLQRLATHLDHENMATQATEYMNRFEATLSRLKDIVPFLLWPVVFISWVPAISMDIVLAPELVLNSQDADTVTADFISTLPVMSPPLALTLLFLGVLAVVSLKQANLLVALLPLLVQVVIVIPFDGFYGDLNISFARSWVYLFLLASWLSMIWFGSTGSITETPFSFFFFLLFFDSVLYLSGSNFTIFGILYDRYVPSFVGTSLTLMGIFFIRSSILLFQQNSGVRKQFEGELLATAKTSFLRWSPMLVFFIFMTAMYWYANNKYISPCIVTYLQQFDDWEQAIDEDRDTPQCAPQATIEVPTEAPAPAEGEEVTEAPAPSLRTPTIEEALLSLIDQKIATLQERTPAVADAIKVTATQTTGDATSTGVNSIDNALAGRLPGTETRRCGFFDVGCYISNGIKSMMNSAYQKHKNAAISGLRADAQSIDAATQANAEAFTNTSTEIASRQITSLQNISKRSVIRIGEAAALVGVVFTIYSILVLMKSYLVVFARVLYSKLPFTSFEESQDAEEASSTKKSSSARKVPSGKDVYTVTQKFPERIFARSDVIGVNVVERKRFPQAKQLALRRILSGTYMLCEIDPKQQLSCDLKVDAPSELVSWTLDEGEEVIFSLADFAAMSESIRLGSRIRLGLASLIFGRTIYHTASGPGTLILKTDSKAITGTSKEAAQTLNAAGLVAWRPTNEFNVDSSPTILDTFLSGSCLRKADGDLIVYDTSQTRRKASPLGGILKFARTFLVPI